MTWARTSLVAIALAFTAVSANADLYVSVQWANQTPTNIGSDAEAEFKSGMFFTRDYNWYVYLDNNIDGPRTNQAWRSGYGYVTVGSGIVEMLPGWQLPAGCYRMDAR